MSKGKQTKEAILEHGFRYVSKYGFVDVSIGKLAIECGLSRSGLFSHFKSKEQLQIDILKYAEDIFIETVIDPSRNIDNALEKIEKLCELWPNWVKKCSVEIDAGCLFMSAAFEFDHRNGAVKDHLLSSQKRLLTFFENVFLEGQKSRIFTKKLKASQIAFDFYSKYIGFHTYKNFLNDSKSDEYLKTSIQSLLQSIKIK